MTRSKILAAGIAAALGLGLAAGVAYAHQGEGCGGMGPGAMAGTHDGAACGMGAGYKAGMKHGMGGPMAGQQLMTPEEHAAFRSKMQNAATPEERQALAAANHAAMQQRAAEKGIALPEQCAQGPKWQSH
jgi:hypothetical protein